MSTPKEQHKSKYIKIRTNNLTDIGNTTGRLPIKDFKVMITKLVHPDKNKKLYRGRVHVKNGEISHQVSKSGHEVSGIIALSMNVCDSNIEVSMWQHNPGDYVSC